MVASPCCLHCRADSSIIDANTSLIDANRPYSSLIDLVLIFRVLDFAAADLPRDCRLVIETYGTSAAAESATAPLLSYRRKVKLVG